MDINHSHLKQLATQLLPTEAELFLSPAIVLELIRVRTLKNPNAGMYLPPQMVLDLVKIYEKEMKTQPKETV